MSAERLETRIAVLEALERGGRRGVSLRDFAQRWPCTRKRGPHVGGCGALLARMVGDGLLMRAGSGGHARFALTPAGHALLSNYAVSAVADGYR